MKNIAIYKPTQVQAEIILKLAESKGIGFYEGTKETILKGNFEEYQYNSLYYNHGEFGSYAATDKKDIPFNSAEYKTFVEVIAAIEEHKETVKVKLTEGYTAELTEEGIKVGCQTISYEAFNRLKNSVDNYKK